MLGQVLRPMDCLTHTGACISSPPNGTQLYIVRWMCSKFPLVCSCSLVLRSGSHAQVVWYYGAKRAYVHSDAFHAYRSLRSLRVVGVTVHRRPKCGRVSITSVLRDDLDELEPLGSETGRDRCGNRSWSSAISTRVGLTLPKVVIHATIVLLQWPQAPTTTGENTNERRMSAISSGD